MQHESPLHNDPRFVRGGVGQMALYADDLQYEHGYGPCVDAGRAGQIFLVDDIRTEQRWPDYAQSVRHMLLEGRTVAALDGQISVQDHSLKAGHDYGQYVRDARNAGKDDIASFFEQVMAEDSSRAQQCHDFLAQLGGTDNTSPQDGR